MLKFRHNYLNSTLACHKEDDYWYEITEEIQFTRFNSQGFNLEPGWITFTVYGNKIRAFYKEYETPTWITYYKKDLPKQCPVIFEFTEKYEVEKIDGNWKNKYLWVGYQKGKGDSE